MISYGNNQEDVLLQRAFAGVEHGFYVDVGAYRPTVSSNTYALYQKGWRGICIEPLAAVLPNWAEEWAAKRPEDTLVPKLAGSRNGEAPFFTCNIRQMSTGSKRVVDHWQADTNSVIAPPDWVGMTTLNDLLDQHDDVPAFHLLCIDVEGMEQDVLAGLDLNRHTPWVIVIEASFPATNKEDTPWASELAKGYELVYRDGINHFYVDRAHLELYTPLSYPPNHWDQWISYREVEMQDKIKDLEAKLQELAALRDHHEWWRMQ